MVKLASWRLKLSDLLATLLNQNEKKEGTLMELEKCCQCDKQAVIRAMDGSIPFCVDHYFIYMKAGYLQQVMTTSHLNYINQDLYYSTGGMIPLKRYDLPMPTFLQDTPIFNTIKIENSALGMLNTGTISNLKNVEFTVELMTSQGQAELAQSITELTQAVINSNEVSKETKDEISQLLQFIAVQINTKSDSRQKGQIKAILAGIRINIKTVAALITILDKVEPIIRNFFQV